MHGRDFPEDLRRRSVQPLFGSKTRLFAKLVRAAETNWPVLDEDDYCGMTATTDDQAQKIPNFAIFHFPFILGAGLKGGRFRPAQICQPRPTSLRFTPSRSPVLLSAPRSKSCSLSVSVISSTTPCSPFFPLFILCSEIPFAWTLARLV